MQTLDLEGDDALSTSCKELFSSPKLKRDEYTQDLILSVL